MLLCRERKGGGGAFLATWNTEKKISQDFKEIPKWSHLSRAHIIYFHKVSTERKVLNK
jgi:hypothetical protein